MIGRVILAALLAGIAAGFLMGTIQYFRITPLIMAAEAYEAAEVPAADGTAAGHTHSAGEWKPADGWQRTLSTFISTMMAGAGWAAALAGISLLSGRAITARNGLIWGLCGFLAASLAPAAGLPPDLPGMPGADLASRQLWWTATIIATAAALWLIAYRRELWAAVAAVILIALPHIIGAPQAPSLAAAVPGPLVAQYITNALAGSAVFWALIGLFLGLAMDRFAKGLAEQ